MINPVQYVLVCVCGGRQQTGVWGQLTGVWEQLTGVWGQLTGVCGDN